MHVVILIGLQASGKSTFFRERFADTHIRINLDMLRTRHREAVLVQACLAAKQPFVVDNTNPNSEDWRRYIVPAQLHGFRVIGYVFETSLTDCLQRNEKRTDKTPIPFAGLQRTLDRLERPKLTDGFDELHTVRINPAGGFTVEAMLP